MRTVRHAAFVLLLVASLPGASGQSRFSSDSILSDSAAVSARIRNVSDAELFAAVDLERRELAGVAEAFRTKGAEFACQAWGEYSSRTGRPRYVTKTSGMMLDTDLLTDPADFRATIGRTPADRDTIISRAEEILRHRIRIWGDRVEQFGPVVDFNRDVGQSGRYGFHYWWWARPLLWAALLSGDDRYLDAFQELFNQWYEQRNSITRGFPDLDVVFYELGIAARTRVFAEYVLMPHANRTPQTIGRLLKTLLGGARWLYELERYEGYRPGNWQIVGAYSLVQTALLLPEFRESTAWLSEGLTRLNEHLERDFFDDGGHSERAPRNYTLLTYLSYRNLCYLLEKHTTAPEVSARVRARMGRTIDWWLAMIAPTGEIPSYNDSHRGLFPVEILRDGARLFGRPAVAGVLRNLFGEPSDTMLPAFRSRHLPASGFTIMRTDWTKEALYFTVTYGPYASHTHHDLLSFEIYGYGRALVVDAGIGMTYDDPLYLTWYKSTRAHNTVAVNQSDMRREGIRGEEVQWEMTEDLEFLDAQHRGYQEDAHVTHRRRVAFVKPDYWFILDDLTGASPRDTLSWYLRSPTPLRRSGSGFRSATAPGLLILPAVSPDSIARGEGMAASTDDLRPGQVQSINWIRFDARGRSGAPVQFPVLLYPFRERDPGVSVTQVAAHRYRITRPDREDHLVFRGAEASGMEWETDAAVLLLRSEGGQGKASLVDGSYLRRLGKTLWQSAKRTCASGIPWDVSARGQ